MSAPALLGGRAAIDPAERARAIDANSSAYCARLIDHATYSDNARALWSVDVSTRDLITTELRVLHGGAR